MRIAKKYNSLLIQVIMVLIMSFTMSFIIVSYNVYIGLCNGISECFVPNFFNIWPRSFLLAFVFGIPIVLIAAPTARKIIDRINSLYRSSGNKNKQFSNDTAQLEL